MSKYITTKKHPELKEGLVFEQSILKEEKVSISFARIYMNTEELKQALEFGYIKEVEKPEFTKSDMIDFLWNNSNKHKDHAKELLNNWIEIKNKLDERFTDERVDR